MTQDGFRQYRRKQIAELRPYIPGEILHGVSISDVDEANGSPKAGDMIARNPKNHANQWLVAAQYFADNFEAVEAMTRHDGLTREELGFFRNSVHDAQPDLDDLCARVCGAAIAGLEAREREDWLEEKWEDIQEGGRKFAVTEEMLAAGTKAIDDYYEGTKDALFEGSVEACYRAMRATESAPPPTEVSEVVVWLKERCVCHCGPFNPCRYCEAATALASLQKEKERLEAQVDHFADGQIDAQKRAADWRTTAGNLSRELAAAKQEIERLREAGNKFLLVLNDYNKIPNSSVTGIAAAYFRIALSQKPVEG